MSLFFPRDFFACEKDIDKLLKAADYLQNFNGIILSKHLFNEIKEIQSILLHNSCLSRTINLFYLKLFDLPDSVGAPTEFDIYHSLASVPEKLIRHLSPRISQALTMLVLKIHKNIAAFAELTMKFLSTDNNFIYRFAYSTFPAIFGYFHLDSLCELGCDFILEFIKRPQNIIQRSRSSGNYFSLPDFNWQPIALEKSINSAIPLITSYFLSMHHFFHFLWTSFQSKVIYQPKNVNEMYLHFCDSLDIAADYLTSHHQCILSTYLQIDRDTCVSILLKNVFATALNHTFPEFQEFYNFLFFLSKTPDSEAVNKLLSILTKPRSYFSSNSNLPFTQIQRVPVVMNDKDICNVLDIINKDKRFASDTFELIQSKGKILTSSYQPFAADIVLTKRKAAPSPWGKMAASAPCLSFSPIRNACSPNEAQEEQSFEDEKEFHRRYLLMQNAASTVGLSELDAIKHIMNETDHHNKYYNSMKPFICDDNVAFCQYALQQYIQVHSNLDSQLNNLMNMKQIVGMLKHFGQSIESAERKLMFCYAENHVQQMMEIIDSKNKGLSSHQRFIKYFEVIMDPKTTPPFLLVSSCIKLLDFLSVKLGSDVMSIMDRYTKYSQNELSNSIRIWADKNSRIASKLNHDVLLLRHKINLKYGQRLVALVSLVATLRGVEKELPYLEFQRMFDFVIEEIKPMKVIETMFIMKMFVIHNKYVKDALPEDQFTLFEDLLKSFIQVLRFDPSLQKELQFS